MVALQPSKKSATLGCTPSSCNQLIAQRLLVDPSSSSQDAIITDSHTVIRGTAAILRVSRPPSATDSADQDAHSPNIDGPSSPASIGTSMHVALRAQLLLFTSLFDIEQMPSLYGKQT